MSLKELETYLWGAAVYLRGKTASEKAWIAEERFKELLSEFIV